MRIDAFSIQVHVRAAQINDGANPKVSLAYELHRPLLTPDLASKAVLVALLVASRLVWYASRLAWLTLSLRLAQSSACS